MTGIIKKDILMIKNNKKTAIVTLLLYLFYTVTFDMDMSFFLPFMALMVTISLFSYDDFNNWHAYVTALPKGKINVVKSRYLSTVVLIIITSIIAVVLSLIIGNIKDSINIKESLFAITTEILAIIFILSVIFPVLFKYGAEKGRFAMMFLGISMGGIVYLFTNVINISIPIKLITFVKTNYLPIALILSVIMIYISYNISKKIYLKKEF